MTTRIVQGVSIPAIMYGTAWKEAQTEELTRLALATGFRAIDTANQRRHYVEAAVGEAVAGALAAGGLTRTDLFLQTKFTYASGQDHRIPFTADADPATQVRQSFESSLEHLRTTFVDSYVLHGPSSGKGLTRTDWTVWRAMEDLYRTHKTRLLGVSNVTLEQVVALHREATIKPAFVQNRCYARTGWDRDVRAYCAESGMVYQGFSLLTANKREIGSATMQRIADRTGHTPAQVVFCFASRVGMLPLTGTSSEKHMRQDLAALDLDLSPEEVDAIERIASG